MNNKIRKANKIYKRNEFKDINPDVKCPECSRDKFRVGYGSCECVGICDCGHRFSLYSG